MKQNFRKHLRPLAVLAAAALLLTGCKGVTEEEKTARENGIALLESGDYEGALDQFEALIQDADRVTDFEVDILKYRAEAEYGLKDYEAAAHTYDILSQIDKERAEYGYFAALSLAKAGDSAGAWEKLEQGRALDEDGTAPGFAEAMTAVGEAYLDSGDQERADAVYTELIQSGKAGTSVYNRLAMAEIKAGDYETALSYCRTGRQSGSLNSTRRSVLSIWASTRRLWSCSRHIRKSLEAMKRRSMRSPF